MTKLCPFMRLVCLEKSYFVVCRREPFFKNWKPCSLQEYLDDTPVGNDFLTRKDVEKKCPEHFKFEEVMEKTKALESIISENYQKKKFSIEGDMGAKENTAFQAVVTSDGRVKLLRGEWKTSN